MPRWASALPTCSELLFSSGSVRIKLGASVLRLEEGDAALFAADVEQVYENTGDALAVMYLVVSYAAVPE